MRFSYFIFGWLLLGCSSSNESRYDVQGTLDGGAKQVIYLEELSDENLFIVIDSAVIDSKNHFKLNQASFNRQDFYRLRLKSKSEALVLVPESSPIEFNGKISSFPFQVHFSTEGNSVSIQRINDSTSIWFKNNILAKNVQSDSIQSTLMEQNRINVKKYLFSFLATHPHDLVGFYAFSKIIDFDLAHQEDYPSLQQFMKSFQMKNPKSRYNLMMHSMTTSLKLAFDGLKGDQLVQPGKSLTSIALKNQNDSLVDLSNVSGNYRVLDFWASWCEPCRLDFPRVKKAESKFHSKGIDFVGVSLDDNAEDWKKFILEKKASWLQVSDLQKWKSIVVSTYGIRSLPTYIVLDKNATVIKKSTDFNEISPLLDSLSR
jgi:thiol-disulfide isomerase/thioredoxin